MPLQTTKETEIFRELTSEEQREMQDIRQRQESDLIKEIAEEKLKHDKENKLFCTICIQRLIRIRMKELGANISEPTTTISKKDLKWPPDWREFSDMDRFELLNTVVKEESAFRDGIKTTVPTAVAYRYRCKHCNGSNRMIVPIGKKGPDGKIATPEGPKHKKELDKENKDKK